MRFKLSRPLRHFALAALCSTATITSGFATDQVQVDLDTGAGLFPFISDSSGTAQDGISLRIGTFNSASDADVQALGYNLLWVNNQFTIMTPGSGNTTTRTFNSQAGSFTSTNGAGPDASWFTSNSSALGRQIWFVYSNNSTLTSSTAYGVASSTNATWDMPAGPSYPSGTTQKDIDTAQININAFGTITGATSSDSLRTASTPTDYLYWDSNAAAGLGGTGTWSNSNSQLGWTTESAGVAASGPYAWGTTSGTSYYAGANLTASFGGTAGTVTVSGTVQTHNGLRFETTGYTLTGGTINLAGSSPSANTITVATGDTTVISTVLAGSTGMAKAGAGTVRLDGASTYTGNTTINGGTLQANVANALQSTGNITVNTGGSLLISASNAVNDSASLTLNSGNTTAGLVLSGNNRSDVMGSLTLSSNSVIDMGTGTGNVWLSFDYLAVDLTSTTQLNIYNYEFGVDHIYFHGNTTNIGDSLSFVNFYSGAGTGFLGNGFLSGPELHSAVVPEPEVYATAILLLLGLGIHYYRRRQPAPLLA